MIDNNYKNSLLIQSQLPAHIRDNPDYSNFVLFLQAYYEWMEQNDMVTDRAKNILNYIDVDRTTDEFIDYFTNEFLPYFPKEILVNKTLAVKLARELYATKGTPASYQFLFRTLYNSEFEYFNTKDVVLKASSGTWYVAKSLKLASDDLNFLKISNYRIFGETSQAIATIETTVAAAGKMEVFISNIERLFQSGEYVRVVDVNNQDILFNDQPLRAKIVGQISQIRIDPNTRGLLYEVGDPVIVYGGLNSANGIGATAVVGSTTKGSIQRINVVNEGFGYTPSPQTLLQFTDAPGAEAVVGSFNPDPKLTANVGHIPIDSIALKRFITIGNSNYHFSNTAVANVNTTLAEAFTFTGFTTYPISSILVTNGGGGIEKAPKMTAISSYDLDDENISDLSALGVLGPIQIADGGLDYEVDDEIVFTNGSGSGAKAKVSGVAANGCIQSVTYYEDTGYYPLGGMGYNNDGLPSLSVQSTLGDGASLYVPSILGTGATFSLIVDRVGSITTINLTEPGEDYISTPEVSLKVHDVLVTGVNILKLPRKGDIAYQGSDITLSSYESLVDSLELLIPNNDPSLSLYNLRLFNYNSLPNPNLTIKIDQKDIELTMANTAYNEYYNEFGIRSYGDGSAKANASFLNGLVISQGQYLTTQGQPSSFDVLQSSVYNNYTYQITVEKEISKYRDVLMSLLHPSGMNVIGRYALKSNTAYEPTITQGLVTGHTLEYYTGYPASKAVMVADFDNKSTNIVSLQNLAESDISGYINLGDTIQITQPHGPNVRSVITGISYGDNTITINDYVWLTYGNVAYVTANSGSNVINITSLTGYYDIINNGSYSNTSYPLKDIVFAGDSVLIDNNDIQIVKSVDYENGQIVLENDLTSSVSNSYMSVNRTIDTTEVILFGETGFQYIPELATEDGQTITTEDDRIILLG